MKVVIKEVGKPAREADIHNNLKAMQRIVGGYIESLHYDYPLVMIMDEEGKLKDKEINLKLPGDTINGDIFFSANDDAGKLRSLKPEEVLKVMNFIKKYTYRPMVIFDPFWASLR